MEQDSRVWKAIPTAEGKTVQLVYPATGNPVQDRLLERLDFNGYIDVRGVNPMLIAGQYAIELVGAPRTITFNEAGEWLWRQGTGICHEEGPEGVICGLDFNHEGDHEAFDNNDQVMCSWFRG